MTDAEISLMLGKLDDEAFVYATLAELLKLFVLCDNDKIFPMLMEVRNRQRKLANPTNFSQGG